MIFSRVWANLEAEFDLTELAFPGEIIWLGGAPGAGKGTNTGFIMDARGITARPVVISDLLNSPRARQIKDAGGLVGDEEVVELLLRTLLEPVYANGVIVDGFPRTKVQVACLQQLYHKMLEQRERYIDTAHAAKFHRPNFSIVLLFVDEASSVARQLKRGREIQESNRRVEETQVGTFEEVRLTDLDPKAARNRYLLFKETTYEALQSLRENFHFYFIDAHGSLEEVQANISSEFAYQSSLELEQETYDRIRTIPLASQFVRHARQKLVERLEDYRRFQPECFDQVLAKIHRKFIPIMERYTTTGMSLINSEDRLFEKPEALAMLIDILADRGFKVVVDVNRIDVPDRIDLKTGQVHNMVKRVYRFNITFPASTIRRGHH